MGRTKYQTPPTPEVAPAPLRAFADRICDVVTETHDVDPVSIVWILLWSVVDYIRAQEDGDIRKAIKITNSLTSQMTKMRWGVTLDGEVIDVTTGEKINSTLQ